MYVSKFERRMGRLKAFLIFIFGFLLGGWLEQDYGVYEIITQMIQKYDYVFVWAITGICIIMGVLLVVVIIYVSIKRRKLIKNEEVDKDGERKSGN